MDYDIQEETLDIIDKNIKELDGGIKNFLLSIFEKIHKSGEHNTDYYTLAVFVTTLFDGDWNRCYSELKKDGFLCLDHIDEFNKEMAYYKWWHHPIITMWKYLMDYLYLDDNLGNFRNCYYGSEFLEGFKISNLNSSTKPFLQCDVSCKKLSKYDGDLYTAICVSPEKFPQCLKNPPHKHQFFYKRTKTTLSTNSELYSTKYGLIWVPLKNLGQFRVQSWLGGSTEVVTALPKSILEKFGLPCTESPLTLDDIEGKK